MNYEIIEKIGEGNKGEVFKVKLDNGKIAALKWLKTDLAKKEYEFLKILNGFYAPKPFFIGKHYFIMELIEGRPLKELIGTKEYYETLKEALIGAYELDLKKIYHTQLGRFYHVISTKKGIKFLDFERAKLTENPRNFLQIIGYYLQRDKKFDKKLLNEIVGVYKKDKVRGLDLAIKVLDECIDETF
ncbi:putative serine/threonine protein kinase [Lebetimonas natsushimae]|uniref:non-specific serine/threonine protein kinase n=1 Tax=Lebetimonas natsushimae TaxID=1936991 RepID=A0A292YDT5_9BACT|nr:RIO1 family regulatory kinase/ATPase [Lebetimonas natsushimae]GAX87410.1 putative serine/threonine protein kinase [Lebetimonas natsushimae]